MAKVEKTKIVSKKKSAQKKESLISEHIENQEKKFNIEGIDYVPYVIGWILGVFNIIFWIIVLIAGLASENKHRFIDYTLHKIVYVYGIVMIILIVLLLFFFILLLLLGITLFGNMMF